MKTTTSILLLAMTAMFAMVTASAQPLPVYTMAGHDVPGSADGLGSYARFNNLHGVAVDSSGNVYVADTGNGTIRKVMPNGSVSTLAGYAGNFGSTNGTGTDARFFAPQGVTVDDTGMIYVADTGNATIRQVSSAGLVATFAGSAGNHNSFDGTGTNANFYQPEGIAVDSNRNVYVADVWNHTIRKITSLGVVTTIAGLAGNPGSVDGTAGKARFNRPSGVTVDSATNLFVTDSLNHTIRKISPGGMVTTIAGMSGVWGRADGTNEGARFFLPQGIAMLNASNLVVVDSGNQTLRRISMSGTNWVVTTIAGLAGSAGNDNGTGSAATFYFSSGIATDDAGYLYVADSGNNNLRTTRVIPPTLQIASVGNSSILSWPVSSEGFDLESSPTLAAGAVWTVITNEIMVFGDSFIRTNSSSSPVFYRLHKP